MKMLPTSTPRSARIGEPHSGRAEPPPPPAKSATMSASKSLPWLTLRRWKTSWFAPATKLGEATTASSATTSKSRRPTREAYPGSAPTARISSFRAGRSAPAPTAFASFVSFSSMSPRTTANTNRSSSPIVATTKTALTIPDLGIPSSRVSSPIVCVLEVATPATGRGGSSGSADGLRNCAT